MAYSEAWMDTFLLSISEKDGSDVELAGRTEGLGVKLGEKDFTQIILNNGGRITKKTVEGITEITFDEYTLGADTTNGLLALFFGDTSDTTQPISVTNTKTRKYVRLAIMWTEDTTATSGAGASAAGKPALRITTKNGYLTAMNPAFDDQILKSALTFKFAPYDSSGTGNLTVESTDGTDTTGLAALGSYT